MRSRQRRENLINFPRFHASLSPPFNWRMTWQLNTRPLSTMKTYSSVHKNRPTLKANTVGTPLLTLYGAAANPSTWNKECSRLPSTRYIPDILFLQDILMRKFHLLRKDNRSLRNRGLQLTQRLLTCPRTVSKNVNNKRFRLVGKTTLLVLVKTVSVMEAFTLLKSLMSQANSCLPTWLNNNLNRSMRNCWSQVTILIDAHYPTAPIWLLTEINQLHLEHRVPCYHIPFREYATLE